MWMCSKYINRLYLQKNGMMAEALAIAILRQAPVVGRHIAPNDGRSAVLA